jgi:hypothetical protein
VTCSSGLLPAVVQMHLSDVDNTSACIVADGRGLIGESMACNMCSHQHIVNQWHGA